MAIRGRGTRRGRGRGRRDPPQPSQSCTSPPPPPPPPPHTSSSPGVENDKNRMQKQGLVKGLDALKNKQKFTAFSSGEDDEYYDHDDGEDKEIQRKLLKETNDLKKGVGASYGVSNNGRPSSGGSHVETDRRKVTSVEAFSNPLLDHALYGYLNMAIRGRRTRRGLGRGCSDPPQPSQLCPRPPPPPPHTSPSPCEDEEMQLIGEKTNQQQSLRQQIADANNVKKGIEGISGVSNNGKVSSATSDSVPHSIDPPANSPSSVPSSGGSHVEIDRRKVISVEAISNPRRFVPQTVTRDIISTVIMWMPTPAEKWKNYPSKMKDELFKEFMDKYKFASDYDHNMARVVWERTCMDRYPDHLKNARKMALKYVNSTNLADTKGHGPKGIKTEIWDGLVDIWLKPEWRKKSDANRSNRAALPDSLLHTGGSISFGEHKRRMEAELKHAVSFRDIYDHVHKKKDGEYVSQRSKNLIESYDTLMLEKHGEDSSMHPVFDSEVWAEVSGTNKKRRTFGGDNLDIGIHGSMATSSSKVNGPSRTIAMTQEDIKEAVNTAMTSFVQTQLVPLLEPILLHLQRMHDDD